MIEEALNFLTLFFRDIMNAQQRQEVTLSRYIIFELVMRANRDIQD